MGRWRTTLVIATLMLATAARAVPGGLDPRFAGGDARTMRADFGAVPPLIARAAASVGARPALLYEHEVGFDEDSRNVTFLGHGVLMLAESGPAHPREVRVFSARTGDALHTLPCPPIDRTRDDLSYRCPRSLAATSRSFVLEAEEVLRVYARSGELLTDIVPPDPLPRGALGFSGGFATRGRRIAQGGPLFADGRRVPGAMVYLFDADSGAVVARFQIDAPDGFSTEAIAFVRRALVVRLRREGPGQQPSMLVAIAARTGAPLWTRDAAAPDGRPFGPGLIGLGSELLVGTDRLDTRTGAPTRTYDLPEGMVRNGFTRVAASGRRVVVADRREAVYVFSSDGALLQTVVAPYEICDLFGETVGISATRLLVTSDSYCGSGHAFVFRLE